jgi:hypothetical protein
MKKKRNDGTVKNVDTDFENLNSYILSGIQILMILLKYQSSNGCCLIKINHIFYKPIIDILYILCSTYEKVYIIKPNSSTITSFDKYIVCKNFQFSEVNDDYLQRNCDQLILFLKKHVSSRGPKISDFPKF